MPRDKGSTCAPDAERTSVLWRMFGCTIGSSAAWQERDGPGSAQTPGHMHPLVASLKKGSYGTLKPRGHCSAPLWS
eukprot:scaffold86992_cov37-Phaeocystis_antarctica.AAC.2